MSNFTIIIKNRSGIPRSYFLFIEAPRVQSGAKVFSNVYITTPTVHAGNGTAALELRANYFAITGTSPIRGLSSSVSVSASDFEIMKIAQGERLGSTAFMTAGRDGRSAQFDNSRLAQNTTTPGAFTIITDNFSLNNGANQFIGLGAQDPLDPSTIVPVATIKAEPNTANVFIPQTKYYISWGTFDPGQIIDVTVIDKPALVDFVGKAASLAKVEHNRDGTYSVTYN